MRREWLILLFLSAVEFHFVTLGRVFSGSLLQQLHLVNPLLGRLLGVVLVVPGKDLLLKVGKLSPVV